MSTLRQAAQQALEALENAYMVNSWAWVDQKQQVITALRAALAEPQTTHWEGCHAVHPECRKPEQEPVAWIQKTAVDWLTTTSSNAYIITTVMKNTNDEAYVPLYTAPTPRKPLADEALHQVIRAGNYDSMEQFARAIERAHGIGGGE